MKHTITKDNQITNRDMGKLTHENDTTLNEMKYTKLRLKDCSRKVRIFKKKFHNRASNSIAKSATKLNYHTSRMIIINSNITKEMCYRHSGEKN